MPYINIKTWPGHSEEQKKKAAAVLQEDLARCFEIDPDWITVGIEEVAPERWDDEVVKPEIEAKPDIIYIP